MLNSSAFLKWFNKLVTPYKMIFKRTILFETQPILAFLMIMVYIFIFVRISIFLVS